MGKPAARMLDVAGHGGSLVLGSTNVFIGGMPAARKGDPLVCPFHGVGVITQGSITVLINGMPAARMTDLTGCLTVGMSAISVPLVLGPPPAPPEGAPPLKGVANGSPQFQGKSHEDTDNKGPGVMAIHAEGQVTDTDKDGSYDTVEGATEAVRMRNQAYGDLGPIEGGVTHNMDVFYANGKATSRAGYGYGVGGTAETGMMKWGAGGSIAPANSSGRNAYAAVGGEANMFRAKAEGDLLLGNDGVRSGLIVKGEAGADVLQGEGVGTATTPTIFGINMQAKGKASAAAGTAAIGGGGWLYYDHAEGRLNIGVSGKLGALLLGAGLEASLSIGREYKDPPPPPPAAPAPAPPPLLAPPQIDFLNTPGFGAAGIPGTVVSGCINVLIGG
ncbi:PAAR domain-containing protein [Fibrella arboris]|uniref:PAAR domain-containing protein n=1 Tax=Fibrella arboris TaxID=3242486 RepID=UPI0035211531